MTDAISGSGLAINNRIAIPTRPCWNLESYLRGHHWTNWSWQTRSVSGGSCRFPILLRLLDTMARCQSRYEKEHRDNLHHCSSRKRVRSREDPIARRNADWTQQHMLGHRTQFISDEWELMILILMMNWWMMIDDEYSECMQRSAQTNIHKCCCIHNNKLLRFSI